METFEYKVLDANSVSEESLDRFGALGYRIAAVIPAMAGNQYTQVIMMRSNSDNISELIADENEEDEFNTEPVSYREDDIPW